MLQEVSAIRRLVSTKTETSPQFVVRNVLWSTFLFVMGGIVGNRSDAFFLQLWAIITNAMTTNHLSWMLVGIMSLIGFVPNCLFVASRASSFKRQQEKDFLFDLSDALDVLLPAAIAARQSNSGLQKFLWQGSSIIARDTLKDIRRGLLFLPDAKGENLTALNIHGWSDPDSKRQKMFCIDPQKDNSARGVAGEAFLEKKMIIAHVSIDNGRVNCDEASYIPSQSSIPLFSGSLICIPIIFKKESNHCLGVLCFDSYNSAAFESSTVRSILSLLARRVALLLSINEKITKEVV